MMRQRFPNVSVLAKSNKVYKIPGSRQGDYDLVTDIQQTRIAMYNMIIHGSSDPDSADQGNCQWLLECLENYKYEFSNRLQQWTDKPLHDKYSNMADALRYMVQATKELDFFGGHFFEEPGAVAANTGVNYEQDWSGVWAR
jgi:hypothetical protein